MVSSRPTAWRTAYACAVVRLCDVLHIAFKDIPLLRILEDNICRSYYRQHHPDLISSDGSIPEKLCKLSEIQATASSITGISAFSILIPTLLAASFYLTVPRPSSRTHVLFLNVIGALMANIYSIIVLYFDEVFNPRWIWMSGIFTFIGGGDLVFYSLVSTVIAESIPHQSLSTFLFYNLSLALAIRVAASAFSLQMMKTSNWLPVLIAVVFKAVSLLIILIFIRDTTRDHSAESVSEDQGLLAHENEPDKSDVEDELEPAVTSKLRSERSSWWPLAPEVTILMKSCLVPILVCSLQEAGNSHREILPYWLSLRYHWNLREAGWVTLAQSLVASAMLALLPWLSKTLQRTSESGDSKERDLNLSVFCLSLSGAGLLLLGFSWNRPLAIVSVLFVAGGTGAEDAYMSYLRATLTEEDLAKVYMLFSMVKICSYGVAAMAIAELYSVCARMGSSWLTSLPMWTCSLLIIVALIRIKWIPQTVV